MNIFHKITLCTLKKNRTRTLVTIIGIMLSTAMFTAVSTSVSSLFQFMVQYAQYNSGSWYCSLFDLTKEEAGRLSADPEVSQTAFLHRLGFARIEASINEGKPYLCVQSMDDAAGSLLPIHLTRGRMPENETELLLPDHLKDNGGVSYALGDTLTLSLGERVDTDGNALDNHMEYHVPENADAASSSGNPETSVLDMGTEQLVCHFQQTYTVVGFYARPSFEDYIAPGYTALTVTGKADGLVPENSKTYDAYLITKDVAKAASFFQKLPYGESGSLNKDLLRFTPYSGETTYNSVILHLALILIAIIMFGSISLIYNAFSISVSERTRLYGILASIGATRKQLQKSVLAEGVFLGIVGIPLGICSGIVGMRITFLAVGQRFSRLLFSEDSPVTLKLHVSFAALAVSVFIALFTILISAWIPARRSLKHSAIETIRQSGDVRLRPRQVKTSLLTQKLFGFEGMLASKNYKRSRKRYRATVLSLFVSIVLFISASSFCSYLSRSAGIVYNEYDFQLSGQISKTTASGRPVSLSDMESIDLALSESKNITDAAYYQICPASVLARTEDLTDEFLSSLHESTDGVCTLFSLDLVFLEDEQFRSYLLENDMDPDEYFIEGQPKGVLVNLHDYYSSEDQRYHEIRAVSSRKQAEFTLALAPEKENLVFSGYELSGHRYEWIYRTDDEEGQDIRIPLEQGSDTVSLRCGAVLDRAPSMISGLDYIALYLPYSQADALFPENMPVYANFTAPFQKSQFDITAVCSDHTAAYQDIRAYLRELPDFTCSHLRDLESEMEDDRTHLMIIHVFSYGFIILISLISVANVFNTISTNFLLRSREFAMLRAVGLSPGKMLRMLHFECLLYGCKGLLYGFPAAIFVTWIIYRAVSGGLEFSFYIPWYSLAIAAGSVFAVVFATMLYSMQKIRKENTAEALKNENI